MSGVLWHRGPLGPLGGLGVPTPRFCTCRFGASTRIYFRGDPRAKYRSGLGPEVLKDRASAGPIIAELPLGNAAHY